MRMVRQSVKPVRWTGRCFFHSFSLFRFLMKNRDMPELGQGEGQEDVDGIHDDERPDAAPGIEEEQDGRPSHEQNAVLDREPVRKRSEPVRKPIVDGHVGHDPRPVHEPGLGPDEEERPFREDRDQGQKRPESPALVEGRGEDGVEGLAGDRRDVRGGGNRPGCPPAVKARDVER